MISTNKEAYFFDFLHWHFLVVKNNSSIITQLSQSIIKNQKLILKKVIKKSITSTPLKLIVSLNCVIETFVSRYSYISPTYDTFCELDVYVYKSLWKWSKKRHPRRSHTWIYSKYWKFIFGRWNFVSFNQILGTFYLLKLHTSFQKETIFCLPASLNLFSFSTENKVSSFWIKQLTKNLKGIYSILWKKQKGVCFLCKQPFISTKTQNFKIVKFLNSFYSKKENRSFILLHEYCFA